MTREPLSVALGISDWVALAILLCIYAWVVWSFFPPLGPVLERLADFYAKHTETKGPKP